MLVNSEICLVILFELEKRAMICAFYYMSIYYNFFNLNYTILNLLVDTLVYCNVIILLM